MRTRDEIAFDDAFDENGRLKPGIIDRQVILRVPLRMIDSADLPKGRDSAVHQPGFITARDDQKDGAPSFSIYDTYDAQISSAWENNPPTGIGSHGLASAGGKQCATCGERSSSDANFCATCGEKFEAATRSEVPRQEIYDPAKGAVRGQGKAYNKADHASVMDGLYSERDRALSEQWRNP